MENLSKVIKGKSIREELITLFNSRIVLIDGAMGTMIQTYNLNEAEYRGDEFKDHQIPLRNNNDILNITRRDIISEIHYQYLESGADIIETNTFNSNKISLSDYKMEKLSYRINFTAAAIAREAVNEVYKKIGASKKRYVAGSLGPTNKTASISPVLDDSSMRNVTFDQLKDAYMDQISGLVEGGVDIILIETIFDTLNSKAAIMAYNDYFASTNPNDRLPLIISGTIVDKSGRTLSGQTVEAFYISISHAQPFCVGLNCSLGPDLLYQFVERLGIIAHDTYIHVYPNAGLPNSLQGYDETPVSFCEKMKDYAKNSLVNMIGGCCGTTPEFIQHLSQKIVQCYPVRKLKLKNSTMMLSGYEEFIFRSNILFVNIGERCNIAGSTQFKKLITENQFEKATEIAKHQVESGAQLLDFNFDDSMIDGQSAMRKFIRICSSDPSIAKVPFVIDSSKFSVIEEGLQNTQGRCIVNSISLKEGEEVFITLAKVIKSYGAAVIVMLFDECGQAVDFDKKISIADRVVHILTDPHYGVLFPLNNIIIDPNILTIATGIEVHNSYGIDFIRACKAIKEKYPYVHISGGLSNLSFSFRGLNELREAMHSVFLFHAIKNGMDMGIVNAGNLPVYDDIDPQMRRLIEDVVLNQSEDGKHVERLIEYAEQMKSSKQNVITTSSSGKTETAKEEWREGSSASERLKYAIIKGIVKYIEQDCMEAIGGENKDMSALNLIEGPLMNGMSIVGDLFGSGKMFLPQVIKSATVMKKAVSFLTPYIPHSSSSSDIKYNGTVLIATVKGDVHDIGKNIVALVLSCNNYKVIDLGVMVTFDKILSSINTEHPDIVAFSGLITPSLDEMVFNVKHLQSAGIKLPILIGGATTSKLHTAIKIAPHYTNSQVIHVQDASRAVVVVNSLLNELVRDDFIQEIREEYESIRQEYYENLQCKKYVSLDIARKRKFSIDWNENEKIIHVPKKIGVYAIETKIEELVPYIDWNYFFMVWGIRGKYPNRNFPKVFNDENVGESAKILYDEAIQMLNEIIDTRALQAKAVYGLFPCNSNDDDDIELYSHTNTNSTTGTHPIAVFHTLRCQEVLDETSNSTFVAMSDFIAPKSSGLVDYIGCFVLTAGIGLDALVNKYNDEIEPYKSLMVKALGDRLGEAYAEYLHEKIRKEFWGYAPNENLTPEDLFKVKYQGVRPAPGYPMQPDHTENDLLFKLLNATNLTGVTLTESLAMYPQNSVSALVFANEKAFYFSVNKIGKDQLEDYARRKGFTVEQMEKWLKHNLNYEPSSDVLDINEKNN